SARSLWPPRCAGATDRTSSPTVRTTRPRSIWPAITWSTAAISTRRWRSPRPYPSSKAGRWRSVRLSSTDTPDTDTGAATDAVDLAGIFRSEGGRIVATLTRLLGDIDLAEHAMQAAI